MKLTRKIKEELSAGQVPARGAGRRIPWDEETYAAHARRKYGTSDHDARKAFQVFQSMSPVHKQRSPYVRSDQ